MRHLTAFCVVSLSALSLVGGRMGFAGVSDDAGKLVMTVGKDRLTRSCFDALVAFRTEDACQSIRAQAGGNDPHVQASLQKAFRRRVLGEYLENRLLADRALGQGLDPDAEVLAGALKVVDEYENRHGRKDDDFLRRFAEMRALAVVGQREIMKEFVPAVTATAVSNVILNIRAYNARISATNAVQAAAASNLWKAVSAPDADFAQLANAARGVCEEEDPDFEWEECTEDGLEEMGESVKKAVLALEAGETAPPVEADNAYLVLKLAGKRTEEDETYFKVLCARFPLAVPASSGTAEEISARLVAEQREAFFRKELHKLECETEVRCFDAGILTGR